MRLALLVLTILLSLTTARAQTGGWQYLPNVGFDIDSSRTPRLEDIYFTDTLTGFGVSLTGRILKTTNGGDSWSVFFDNIDFPYYAEFRSIEFLADGLTGIAGSTNGYALRTVDGGANWISITDSVRGLPVRNEGNICGLAHFGDTFYGIGWWGARWATFYKSTNKGVTWTATAIDTSLATGLVDVYFISQDTGFATGGRNTTHNAYSSNESVVLKTTDGGATWTKVFSDTTIGGRIWKIQFVNADVAVGSVEPYFYPDSVNMIISNDRGNTWRMIHAGSFHNSTFGGFAVVQGVGFVTPTLGWIGGYCNGLFQTKDGGATWDTLSFGTNTNRIFVLDSNHAYAGGKYVYKWGRSASDRVMPILPMVHHHKLYPVVPNPARGDVLIQFDLSKETNVSLDVANVDAKLSTQLLNTRLKAGHYSVTWRQKGQPNGNYLVWLGTDDIPFYQRFVLSR